jgi:hypothetical protein
MEKLPSEVHGVIDYLTAGMLMALPRMFRWSSKATTLMTGAALGTMVYSLMTRYELGLFKMLPFKTHLALDAMNGAMFAAAPLLMPDEDPSVTAAMVGIGVFELAVIAMSNPEPFQDDWANDMVEQVRGTASERIEGMRDTMQGIQDSRQRAMR